MHTWQLSVCHWKPNPWQKPMWYLWEVPPVWNREYQPQDSLVEATFTTHQSVLKSDEQLEWWTTRSKASLHDSRKAPEFEAPQTETNFLFKPFIFGQSFVCLPTSGKPEIDVALIVALPVSTPALEQYHWAQFSFSCNLLQLLLLVGYSSSVSFTVFPAHTRPYQLGTSKCL